MISLSAARTVKITFILIFKYTSTRTTPHTSQTYQVTISLKTAYYDIYYPPWQLFNRYKFVDVLLFGMLFVRKNARLLIN